MTALREPEGRNAVREPTVASERNSLVWMPVHASSPTIKVGSRGAVGSDHAHQLRRRRHRGVGSLGPTLISVWMVAAWVASTLRPSSLAPMGLTQDGEGVRLGQLGTDDTARQPGLPESIKAADWKSVTFGVASDVSAPRVP